MTPSPFPRTTWKLVALNYPSPPRSGLNVTISVDTDADAIIDAIEVAAEANGLELERVDDADAD